MGRSNKEEKDKLGTGLLENARKVISGRPRSIEDALDEAEGVPAPKKKKKASDEESE